MLVQEGNTGGPLRAEHQDHASPFPPQPERERIPPNRILG